MKKTPWMVRTAYRLSALVLAGALTGCAVAPQHPGLQAAQEAGQLAPLLLHVTNQQAGRSSAQQTLHRGSVKRWRLALLKDG